MTIRLTSIDNFEKVLTLLKEDPLYNEKLNWIFFKYCVNTIKKGLAEGTDEYFLMYDYIPSNNGIVMCIRYYKYSDVMTDEEYNSQPRN